jgi:PKD repeat protein
MSADRPPEGRGPHSDTTMAGVGRQPVRLRVQVGENLGRAYTMSGDTLTIGRAQDNDLVLDDAQISRYHARLTRKDRSLIVEDLGSTNGTLVNGRRISGPHALQPTETIAVGSTVFSVEGFDAPSTLGIPPVRDSRRGDAEAGREQQKGTTPWLIIGGVIGLFVVVVLVVVFGWLLARPPGGGTPSVPYVYIQSPVAGSRAKVGEPVFVNAVASDTVGVTRAELWIAGSMVAEQESAIAEGQPTFPVNLSWTPTAPGNYTLEVRVFNSQGTASAPTTVMISVEEGDLPTPTPSPSQEPTEVGPTPGGVPVAVTTVDLNVREGPGQAYAALALLPVGSESRISGKNADGTWWQIVYPPDTGGRGWIYAPFTRASGTDDVPVVETPPPPTSTLTPTPLPTATAVPAITNTPTAVATPTRTPTSVTDVVVEFSAEKTTVMPSECLNLQWHIENVTAAFLTGGEFNNIGVTGPYGSRSTCPRVTTVYLLKAETPTGVVERTVTVNVEEPKTVTLGVVGGSVRQDGKVDTLPVVGDDENNLALRAFLGFDLSGLKGKQVVDAQLDLSSYSQSGSPFSGLGRMYLEEVDIPASLALNLGSYSAAVRASLATFDDPSALATAVDVTGRLSAYVANDQPVYPVRLRFEIETNNNGVDDNTVFTGARLTVRYYD